MNQKSILATMLIVALALSLSGCGASDHLQSITITPGSASGVANLPGVDATLQLIVTANYNSGKTVDVTNQSTFTVTTVGSSFVPGGPLPPYGPDTVPINPTGMMTAIASLCTWEDLPDPTTGKPQDPPAWVYTGYYQVIANYKGMTSQPIGVGVGSASSNAPKGGCGPS